MPDQNLIDYIIKNKKLSQSDLAKELGVSRAQVTKSLSGNRYLLKGIVGARQL